MRAVALTDATSVKRETEICRAIADADVAVRIGRPFSAWNVSVSHVGWFRWPVRHATPYPLPLAGRLAWRRSAMGEAENRQAEANDLSGGTQKDRGGSESTVGEGEARAHPRDEFALGFRAGDKEIDSLK